MGQSLYEKCKNLSILFVEDYLPLQKKISSVLGDYFDYVQTASNGEEGLERYKEFQEKNGKFFDIVMTDYEMPKVNGIELIRTIKEQNKDQVFIVISAHQNPEYLIEFINLGILHFIPKPIGPENMLEVLEKVSDIAVLSDELLHINSSLVWNKTKKSLFYKDELLNLAKYDLLLLEVLLEDFGFICTIERILNHFYIYNEDIKQENIRNMVVRLRKKIPEITITSMYAIGYKLNVDT
ncbi:response regulator [Sulfurimonas sp. HSL3-2]|uniref:response regulator n=1 Tax=Hydrocurvibacter mobilis TaxID=3131936 RepID=UPI0031F9CCB6